MTTLFFKYFLKQKKFVFFILFIVIFSLGNSIIERSKNHRNSKNNLLAYEESLKYYNKINEKFENDLKKVKSEGEKDKILNSIKENKISIINMENLILAQKNSDWNYLYDFYRKQIKAEPGDYIPHNVRNYPININTIKISYEIFNYLKENNLSSAYPIVLHSTEYDKPTNKQDKMDLDSITKKYFIGTNHRLWEFFKGNIIVVYIIIIVIGTGNLFGSLYDTQHKTIRFLKSSCMSNYKIYSSGIFVGGVFTIILGILTIGITYIIEFLISGYSSLKYPVIKYFPMSKQFSMFELKYKIVPISNVLMESIILFLLYGFFIFLVSSTFSMIIKSQLKSTLVTFTTILGLQMFPKYYNPFSYWKVGNVVDGSFNIQNQTTGYIYTNSIKTLLISIFILFAIFITFSYFERKVRSE